jgi:hypothetical protein
VPSRRTPTIAAAVARAAPETTISVAPGHYVEGREESAALTIGANDICLIAPQRQATIQAAPGQSYGLVITGSRVVVSGIGLDGFAASVSLGRDDGGVQRSITITRSRIRARTTGWSEGIVAYADHRDAGRPVVDGLTVDDVQLSGVSMGVSCNAGPCAHWWLRRVRVAGRAHSADSGADAFAIESGRQIVVTDSRFAGVGADGIDTKATDVVIARCRVDVGRNAIKLWHGGDVSDTMITRSGADAALVGDGAGRYRYRRIRVSGHDPGGTGYVGTWGYDTQAPIQLQISRSVFRGNATGGFYAPAVPGTSLAIDDSLFADVDSKLLEYGAVELTTTRAGLAALAAHGWGQGNRLG